ncbi:S41 family peptidase [Brytella acorum]|uniref:S41 family peptidase n=1 Tax=Brytella acorum TaxID=2959299 RepID=A0AA35Y0S6_9PROT|nr:S41 family peptidase [Brytella acorum]MDF3623665.1 S41 family peptidase [Brytella acorum]CAI9119917.1 S41 family peptidase [Brytella acorum]
MDTRALPIRCFVATISGLSLAAAPAPDATAPKAASSLTAPVGDAKGAANADPLPGAPSAVTATSATESPSSVSAPFDGAMIGAVLTSALRFIEPRTLDPHSAHRLCWWGLDGLTAIDPALAITEVPAKSPHEPAIVQLINSQTVIGSYPMPQENDVPGWVSLVVHAAQDAWSHSDAVRSSGDGAILQSFFDELFNHLDPYSRYIAPTPAVQDRTNRIGGSAGIGISLKRDGKGLYIASVNATGPAWAAGVNTGQRLYAVNGHTVRDATPEAVMQWLSGEADSAVSITIADPGRRRATVSMRRDTVPPQTVFVQTRGHVAILRIAAFSTNTADELSQYLDQITQNARLDGLILDLRGDRGGVLQQAVTAASLLLDKGVAVITKGRDPQANHVWAVRGGDMTKGAPIAIMVDGRTASAAEILAAALADHRRAVVIGSATLGKGLVQTIGQMPDGGELFVTWSRVLAPLGWPLQGLGVMPQICTSRGSADTDRQLRALRGGTSSEAATVKASRAARYPLSVANILDIRRDCPAALGTDADLDAAFALLNSKEAYRAAVTAIPDDLADAPK